MHRAHVRNKKVKDDSMTTPKTAVITPDHNTAATPAQCIDSALGQRVQDMEIHCADEGSKDKSPDILVQELPPSSDLPNHIKNAVSNREPELQGHVEPSAEPDISIILPVHNALSYLPSCIESILRQSHSNFELIISDDASTDTTVAYVQSLQREDLRIRLIQNPKIGAGPARNQAISHARGRYLAFVDADDILLPDYLKKLYTAAEEFQADVVITDVRTWFSKGEGEVRRYFPMGTIVPLNQLFSSRDYPDHILNITNGMPGGKLVRRSFAQNESLEFASTKRFVDINFTLYGIAKSDRTVYIEDAGYLYRKDNPNSLQATRDETPLLFLEAHRSFRDKLIDGNCFDIFKRSYINKLLDSLHYNMRTLNSFDALSEVFQKLPEICSLDLEMDTQDASYYHDAFHYEWIMDALKYHRVEDFLFAVYKGLARSKAKTKPKPKPEPAPTPEPGVGASHTTESTPAVPKSRIRRIMLHCKENGIIKTGIYAFRKVIRKLHSLFHVC